MQVYVLDESDQLCVLRLGASTTCGTVRKNLGLAVLQLTDTQGLYISAPDGCAFATLWRSLGDSAGGTMDRPLRLSSHAGSSVLSGRALGIKCADWKQSYSFVSYCWRAIQ